MRIKLAGALLVNYFTNDGNYVNIIKIKKGVK